jgi:DNA invertase Pin-like site-specific DNA recombinase
MTGQQIGYMRVSSFDQHPERQLDGIALDQSFIDKASGKDGTGCEFYAPQKRLKLINV